MTKRKSLALLAIDALPGAEAESLQAHLAACAGCRGYLREIEQTALQLSAAAAPAKSEPSPYFYQRTRQALRCDRSRSGWLRFWVPLTAAVAFVGGILSGHKNAPAVAIPPVAPGIVMQHDKEISPTLLNYETAANQSADKLDDVLAKEAGRELPSASVYRAGTWAAE